MQAGIRFEKIPSRAPRKSGDLANVTYRRVVRREQSTVRRQARRLANIVKGRA